MSCANHHLHIKDGNKHLLSDGQCRVRLWDSLHLERSEGGGANVPLMANEFVDEVIVVIKTSQ